MPESLKDKFKEISINYDKGWKDNLLDELRESFVKDQARGFTSLGPQTSDLRVKIKKQDSGNILSRGEQKLLILLIYLFFIKAYNDLRPNKTILLLDDLPSELDKKNLDLALSLLQDADCQLFITSLEKLEKYEFDFVIDL
jgi:DNA replication and repair protein RecF